MKPHSTTGLWRCGVAIWRNTLTAAWEPNCKYEVGSRAESLEPKLPTARKYYEALPCLSPQLIESERAGEDKQAFWVSSLRQLGQAMRSVPQ
jgi:hypothetical protein